jgi:hypothetical protein
MILMVVMMERKIWQLTQCRRNTGIIRLSNSGCLNFEWRREGLRAVPFENVLSCGEEIPCSTYEFIRTLSRLSFGCWW